MRHAGGDGHAACWRQLAGSSESLTERRRAVFIARQIKQRAGAEAVVVDAAAAAHHGLWLSLEHPGKGDARRKAEAPRGKKVLPVVAQAGRNGEAVVELELVLDERAHLLLVIDEVRIAGVLREAGGQVAGVILQRGLQHRDAVGGQRGAEGVGAERVGVVVEGAAVDVRRADARP